MPVDHVDWLAEHVPYPEPSQDEILADRASRLEQLDKIQAERMEMFQDMDAGLNWLKKQRGSGGKVDFEWWREHLPPETEEGLPLGDVEHGREWKISVSFQGEASELADIARALVKMAE